MAAASHVRTITRRIAPRYGVEFARDPNVKIMNCWISAPPDFPRGLQTTSMAAFPLTYMHAVQLISMQKKRN